MDGAYSAKFLTVARMLWNASKGNPGSIPDSYCEHLSHDYVDGSISLAFLLNRFENEGDLEDYEVEEAVELLGRVNPEDWPFAEDIEAVDVQKLLNDEEVVEETSDYVEDNLGTSEKVQKALKGVIESVFSGEISAVRGKGGSFPSPNNNFLQESDGTFAGTFESGNYGFEFEIAPTESGWLCTYRLTAESLNKVPRSSAKEKKEDGDEQKFERRVRARGWR